MNILTIHSAYAHHSENSGYKQILKFIKPKHSLQYNERDLSDKNWFQLRYRWSIEFEIRKYLKETDLIHVLYGEEYLRFTPFLYPKKPLVVTFHLPPSTLKQHLEIGNGMGKIDSLTHKLTKARFQKIDRVIITEKNQSEALNGIIPEEKIRVIPLGIYLNDFFDAHKTFSADNLKREDKVIVLGNWLRDWGLLKAVANLLNNKGVKVHLVGRNIPKEIKADLSAIKNIQIEKDLTDLELKKLLYSCKVSFLPLKEAAGNNALMESLAMGCHVVMSDVVSTQFPFKSNALNLINNTTPEKFVSKVLEIYNLSQSDYDSFAKQGQDSVMPYEWSQVAKKTIEVYKELV